MANIYGHLQSTINSIKKKTVAITATILDEGESTERRGLDVVIIGGEVAVSELPDLEVDLAPSAISGGIKTVTTTGTGEALVTTATPCQYVIINALSTNTGIAYIGGSDVDKTTKNGIALTVPADSAGVKAPASCIIPIDDAAKIYVDVTVSGEGVQFVILT